MKKKSVSRPERVAIVDLDDAIKASVERAEQVTELSKEALESTIAGTRPPGITTTIKYE